MSDDSELERLKARRLAEMKKNIQHAEDDRRSDDVATPAPRDVLVGKLGYRGQEVLAKAEVQFPRETRIVVEKLAELILAGELAETLDGGRLLALFRNVGLNIRMNIRISVEQDGKFVSLAEKVKGQVEDGGNGK